MSDKRLNYLWMSFTLPLAVRLIDTVVSHRDLNHVDLDKFIMIVYTIIINLPKSTRFKPLWVNLL